MTRAYSHRSPSSVLLTTRTDHTVQREVAVLSGLVFRGLSIGAWVSHIVVTSEAAVEGSRMHFGLPTNLGTVEFAPSAALSDAEGWRQDAGAIVRWVRAVAEDVGVALKVCGVFIAPNSCNTAAAI